MSELKHTPGPWQCYADVPSTDPDWHIVTNASRMRVLANVHIEPGNEMDLANARLIAAAPDLLEIAKEHATSCPSCNGTGQRMHSFDRHMVDCEKCRETRAAIAKATGVQQ